MSLNSQQLTNLADALAALARVHASTGIKVSDVNGPIILELDHEMVAVSLTDTDTGPVYTVEVD